MPGTDVLQRVTAVEMLGTCGEIDPLGPIAAVAEIIRVVVIEHRVEDIDVDAASPVDDPNQSLQTDPRVVMDRDLEDPLDRRPRQWRATAGIRQVDLGLPMGGDVDP